MEPPILFGAPPGVRAGAVAELLARDYEVLRTADLAAAFQECRQRLPAAVVLPFDAGTGEEEVLRFLRAYGRRTPVFLYVEEGTPPEEAAQRALTAGAREVLDATAPDFGAELRRRLARLLGDQRLRHAEEHARAKLLARHNVVGASPAMHDVFRRAITANQFDNLPVLIEGEPGTPRRRVASAVLYLDPTRVRMPFFALGCAELGGVLDKLRGLGRADARTVAEQWRGLLRAASGGTIFLDAIGALKPDLQRTLVEVMCRRPPALRVIATTERPAEELVATGRLDAELAAWFGLFRIPLPPLRGRPEDIAAQARHVLDSAGAESATDFGPGVIEALQRLPWEGNTAQLEGVLLRALTDTKRGTVLRLDDLPAWVHPAGPHAPPPRPVPHPGDAAGAEGLVTGVPLGLIADEFERRALRTLLSRQGVAEIPEGARPDHSV
jgi:DNA-binding NtrC family response regulator